MNSQSLVSILKNITLLFTLICSLAAAKDESSRRIRDRLLFEVNGRPYLQSELLVYYYCNQLLDDSKIVPIDNKNWTKETELFALRMMVLKELKKRHNKNLSEEDLEASYLKLMEKLKNLTQLERVFRGWSKKRIQEIISDNHMINSFFKLKDTLGQSDWTTSLKKSYLLRWYEGADIYQPLN